MDKALTEIIMLMLATVTVVIQTHPENGTTEEDVSSDDGCGSIDSDDGDYTDDSGSGGGRSNDRSDDRR